MIDARAVEVPIDGDRTIPAELVLPDPPRAEPGPAVLVIHEAMGLNDDIRGIARRFARAGYVALAPDLVGRGPMPVCIARFAAGVGRVGTGRPYRDLAAAQRWLGERPDVDPARIGVAGFCMGGGFAILYALHGGEPVRAIAPFYAALPRRDEELRELCPTVASFGGRDGVFGRGGDRLRTVLTAAGIPNDVRTYPDAGHSFMSVHDGLAGWPDGLPPMHAGYHAPSAEDAWARVLAFFEEHLARADAPLDHRHPSSVRPCIGRCRREPCGPQIPGRPGGPPAIARRSSWSDHHR